MIPLTYTHSFDLQQVLAAVETTRRDILTSPLSVPSERSLWWDGLVSRIAGTLYLSGEQTSKTVIAETLLKSPRHPTLREWTILTLRDAYDRVRFDWTASSTLLSWNSLQSLSISLNDAKLDSPLSISDKEGTATLSYLQTATEHAVVQAAIATAWLTLSPPYPADRGKTARLIGCLFLARNGYDCRGFAAIERQWTTDRGPYDRALASIAETNNLTRWILFYAQSVLGEYQHLSSSVSAKTKEGLVSVTKLTSRQCDILKLADHPDSVITNKIVQKQFNISQITASRELARLANLGLLRTHGKGRSVHYTRV